MFSKKLFLKAGSLLLIAIFLLSVVGIIGFSHNSDVKQFEASRVFVDPKIAESSSENVPVILYFSNLVARDNGLFRLNKFSGVKVLVVYRSIPAVFAKVDASLIHKLSKLKGLVAIFYNREYRLLKAYPIKDGIKRTTLESSKAIGADTFWNNGYNGSGIKIGIIDTGIDPNHPDFQGKIVAMESFVRKVYGYDIDEDDPTDGAVGVWHGTRVAGVAAGAGYGDKELGTGVAPGALILSAKVFPSGSETRATLAGIIAAIEWCVNQGADVINMSLGGGAGYFDPLMWVVEWAVKHGVTVVVAAGNEGLSGGITNYMSVASPGVSPYAITVAAADINGSIYHTYSSIGPTLFLTSKPDITAPSGVAAPISTKAGVSPPYGEPAMGTSFSSPHVAGAAALLAQFLKESGIDKKYWPGIIKTVLVKTARPIISGNKEYYDETVGAGFVDLEAAYNYLINAVKDPNGVPLGLYVSPRRIPTGLHNATSPYFPYKQRVFWGMRLEFNFSIILPVNTTVTVSLEGNISSVINLHSPTSFLALAPTYLWEFNATFAEGVSGYFEGNIVFSTDFETFRVPISFKLLKPKQRWLLDLRHTSWSIDIKYGQYLKMFLFLEGKNISVDQWYFGAPELTLDILSKYDLIFVPDTASRYYIFTKSGFVSEEKTLLFTDRELEAFTSYIENGGAVIFIGMDPEANNITELNRFVGRFGIEFGERLLTREQDVATFVGNHILVKGVYEMPFYGVGLKVRHDVMVLAKYDKTPVAALYSNSRGGFLLVFSTNFHFDNWALSGIYGVPTAEVKRFIANIVNLVDEQKRLNITITPDSPTKGSEFQIEAKTDLANVEGIIVDYLSSTNITFTKQTTWIATYTPKLAGEHLIIVIGYYGDGSYIYAMKILDVAKSETTLPAVQPEYENGTLVEYRGGDFTINITITDNDELIDDPKMVKIKANVSTYTISGTVVSKNKLEYQIKITGGNMSQIFEVAGGDTFVLKITVKVLDANLNEYTATYIFEIKRVKAAPPMAGAYYVGVAIAIIAIVLIVAYLAIARRK